MDLWYIANRARGSLPNGFAGLNTVEIAERFGFACHAVRADFTLTRPAESLMLRGFALDNHPDYPYRVELRGLPFKFEHDAENLKTEISTPAGSLLTHIRQSAGMTREGVSVPFVLSHPIRSLEDFEPVAQVYEHIEVLPAPEQYAAFRRRLGEQGVAVAHGLNVASPMHLLLHDLIAMDNFFYLYMDVRERLHELAERIAPFFDKVLEAVLDSDCDLFFWGGNYDQNTTYPDFFAREIRPWLRRAAQRAEKRGKRLLTHTDGENRLLLPFYPDSGFHVAESVCPSPMTQLTLKEFRDGVGGRFAVWGGVPAVALLEDAMSEREFAAYLDRMFGELGDGRGLILGVSDNVPPEADLGRLEEIGRRIEAFGPVG